MKSYRVNSSCSVALLVAILSLQALAASVLFAPAATAGTKTISGKLRAVEEKILTIEEKKLLQVASVEVEIDSRTKVTGELVPGMMIKVKYREVAGENTVRRIALQVKTWPEYSSRRDRKAAPDTQP